MANYTKYPEEMKLRAFSLKKQRISHRKITNILIAEFPDVGKQLQARTDGGQKAVESWFYNPQNTKLRLRAGFSIGNNNINKEDLGIVEHFALVPHTVTSDRFNQIAQSIPELLIEKREELVKIQKQIRQLELMSNALDEELEEDQPVEATG